MIQHDGNAPYAPPGTLIELIEAYRDRGLTTPFSPEVLTRAGVPTGLVNRVLQSLKLLDLIGEDGMPTEQFQDLRTARGDEYRDRLQAWVQGTYAEVLAYTNPVTDSPERVAEAFRGLNPTGQRNRMVTLMLGLFRYAGLIEGEVPKRTPRTSTLRTRQSPTTRKTAAKQPVGRDLNLQWRVDANLPPALMGLLQQVPFREGWTARKRDDFLAAFKGVLDFTVPLKDEEPFDPWETEKDEEEPA